MKSRKAVNRTVNTVIYIVLTALCLLWLLPLVYLVAQSFRAENGAWSTTFFPQSWTLDNYIRLFTQTQFTQWFLNTLLVAALSCIITTVFVLSVAYTFSRLQFRARRPLMNVMLVLGMFPGFMSMTAVYFLLKILLPSSYQLSLIHI